MTEDCQITDTDSPETGLSTARKLDKSWGFDFCCVWHGRCKSTQRRAMRVKHLIHRLMVVSVITVLAATGAQAQTRPKAPVATPSRSAFDKLSLGNQKVAAALYYAQSAEGAPKGATPSRRKFTLEAIAVKRQSGQTWGEIFRELRAQGLVHEKSLGQVVARYQQTLDSTPGLLASDTSVSRPSAYEAGSDGSVGGAVHGVGKGGK